jgi:DNA-binding NtrC family response regulator
MSKKNILLADNDPDFLVTRKEYLEHKGYRVIPVQNIAEARDELTSGHTMLAILDIRLVDDDDEKDVSGLLLAKDAAYLAIPKIILTGFPSTGAVREALRPELDGISPAIDFLYKREGPSAMLDAVERALSATPLRSWQPYLALAMLLSTATTGIMAIVFADPRWLAGTTVLSVLYAFFTWWATIE